MVVKFEDAWHVMPRWWVPLFHYYTWQCLYRKLWLFYTYHIESFIAFVLAACCCLALDALTWLCLPFFQIGLAGPVDRARFLFVALEILSYFLGVSIGWNTCACSECTVLHTWWPTPLSNHSTKASAWYMQLYCQLMYSCGPLLFM